jgi:hypothetical protein
MAFDRLADSLNEPEWRVFLRSGDLLAERLRSMSIRPVEASRTRDSAGDGEMGQRRRVRGGTRYFAFTVSPVGCRGYILRLACGGRQ